MGKQKRICYTGRALLELLQGHSFSPTTKLVALVRYLLGGSFTAEQAAFLMEAPAEQVKESMSLLGLVGTFDAEGRFSPKPGRQGVDVGRQERGRGAELLAEFSRMWEGRYESRCVTTSKDKMEADKLVKQIGLEEAKRRLVVYFADPDDWLGKNAHPFVVFCRQANRFIGRKDGKGNPGIAKREDIDREVERLERRTSRQG